MSTPSKYSPKTNTETLPPPLPRCPHCGTELAALCCFNWQMGAWGVLEVHCPNKECSKVLSMQIVPTAAMGRDPSAIVMPQ